MANLALIYPVAAAVGATYAVAAWVWRRYKAAALDGVYPGSPEHQAALKSVEDRTAPQFGYWPDLPTAMQTAHDPRPSSTPTPSGAAHDRTPTIRPPSGRIGEGQTGLRSSPGHLLARARR